MQIFRILLEDGQLDRDSHSDLFIEYLNAEVQEILSELEEEMDCKIIKINNSLYLLPQIMITASSASETRIIANGSAPMPA